MHFVCTLAYVMWMSRKTSIVTPLFAFGRSGLAQFCQPGLFRFVSRGVPPTYSIVLEHTEQHQYAIYFRMDLCAACHIAQPHRSLHLRQRTEDVPMYCMCTIVLPPPPRELWLSCHAKNGEQAFCMPPENNSGLRGALCRAHISQASGVFVRARGADVVWRVIIRLDGREWRFSSELIAIYWQPPFVQPEPNAHRMANM